MSLIAWSVNTKYLILTQAVNLVWNAFSAQKKKLHFWVLSFLLGGVDAWLTEMWQALYEAENGRRGYASEFSTGTCYKVLYISVNI